MGFLLLLGLVIAVAAGVMAGMYLNWLVVILLVAGCVLFLVYGNKSLEAAGGESRFFVSLGVMVFACFLVISAGISFAMTPMFGEGVRSFWSLVRR